MKRWPLRAGTYFRESGRGRGRPPQVYHVCGDFQTLTGGTLVNREIARELVVRFGATVIHPSFPRALYRLRHTPGSLLVTNAILAVRPIPTASVFVIDHGHSRDTCLAVWLWKWLRRCTVIHTIGHLDFNAEHAKLTRMLLAAREYLWAAAGDHLFTVSRSTAGQLARIPGASRRIRIMPVTRSFGPREPQPIRAKDRDGVLLLFVGNVDARKGVDQGLRALSHYRGTRSITYQVVGAMPANPHTTLLRELASRNRAARVEFHGRVSRAQLEARLLDADAFLFPSHWEGYGIAIEEAMSFALPVIACRVGGVPEVVMDGDCGWVVEDGDVAAMARAITDCVDNGEERIRRGARAHARARGLSRRRDPGRPVGDCVAAALSGGDRSATPAPLGESARATSR